MMIYVVIQDNVMHDGFQDATSADERPKAQYVTFKVFLLLSGINDVIRNEWRSDYDDIHSKTR